jgi:2-dehydropantoate 2-reductase
MRFLCVGVGAIGTYVGGSLAASGERVVFLAHPASAAVIRKLGMRIRHGTLTTVVENPIIVETLSEAMGHGPFDLALLAMKAYDVGAFLEQLAPLAPTFPPVLCLQNGVEAEEAVGEVLGDERVLAGSITSAIGRDAPGDITIEKLRGMGIAGGALAQDVLPILSRAGLRPQFFGSAASMKWSKLLTNLLANATSAILGMTPREIYANPALFRVEVAQIRETLRVMHRLGARTVSLPGAPAGLLAFLMGRLPPALSRPLIASSVGRGRGAKPPSLAIDLRNGSSKSEVEFLNGAVVREGEHLGLPTPVNRFLWHTLSAMVRGEVPQDTYLRKPKKFLDDLHSGQN